MRQGLGLFSACAIAGDAALILIGIGIWRSADDEEKRSLAVGSVPISGLLFGLGCGRRGFPLAFWVRPPRRMHRKHVPCHREKAKRRALGIFAERAAFFQPSDSCRRTGAVTKPRPAAGQALTTDSAATQPKTTAEMKAVAER